MQPTDCNDDPFNGYLQHGDVMLLRQNQDWYRNENVNTWGGENVDGEVNHYSSTESKGTNKNLCRIIVPIFGATICLVAICIAMGTGIYFGVIDPSRRTSPFHSVTFQGSLIINRTFTPGLNDSSSPEYKDLAKNVTLEVDNAYKSSSLLDVYGYSNVTGFSSGSIVAHMQIHFIADQSSGTAVTVDFINTTLNQQLTQSNSSFAGEIIPVLINLIDIAASTTPEVTTRAPTTTAPTTQTSTTAPTTQSSTTASSTTQSSTTAASTTQSSTTASSATQASTAASTTKASTTAAPTTNASTTAAPTTQSSTTAASTTQASTAASTTKASTTTDPTTQSSTAAASTTKALTNASTTQSSTTVASITQSSTNASTAKASITVASTTNASTNTSTTQASTTTDPTTQSSTTAASTTKALMNASTTQSSTTVASITQSSTNASTTKASTTAASTTQSSATNASKTQSSTTVASTTYASTTAAPTTNASTTAAPTTQSSTTAASTTKASTNASTTKASTTTAPTNQSSTTAYFTIQSSTIALSTTQASRNASTTQASTTAASTTQASINASTTQSSTTAVSTTNASTTALQKTLVLQTSAPTTATPDSRDTLCPIETFYLLLQGNCSAPLGVMHNPESTELGICGAYEDLLKCLAFHMMLAGMDQCKMEAINNIIFQNFTSVVYTSSGRSLTQNCTNTDLALLQAEIPGQSSEEMCSSISTMRYYMKNIACHRSLNFSVNLMVEVHCGIAFGILYGIQSFFHGFGFNCEFTQLMSTVSKHEQNSTLQNKLLPPYLLDSLHTCQDFYFNGSLSNDSRLQCAQILANNSCPVVESLNPLIKMRNTTVYTSDLKCSVYYEFIKRMKTLLHKTMAYLPCNNEILKTMVNGFIEGYWMESGQNMVQALDFQECTALETVDQLGSLCNKDTLVALSVMFCPIRTQSESIPILINPTTADQRTGSTQESSGMAVSTSWGQFCYTYQNLLQCGLQIANSMDFGSEYNCSHGEMEILFERVERDNYGLLSNSLPGGLNPVYCSNYSSMFIIELKLNQEWTESLNNASSPEYMGMIQKIQQSIDQLVNESFLSEFVAEVKVIQIGNWSGWVTTMQTDVNLTVKMKSTARLQSDDVRGGLISAIMDFISINPIQEIIPKINLFFIYVQPVYSEPSPCTPETFKDLEGTACHQFVNISLLTEEQELCRMYVDLLKCFRLQMLLYHGGDCTFSRIDRIVMATDTNVFRKKEGFIRSHCNSYFNLTTEERILPAEGAVCSSTEMIQHVMSQCNAKKVNMTMLDTDSLCRVRIGSISCITETFASHNYSCDRDKIRTAVLSLPVGNGNCTAVYGAANQCDQYIMENYQVANHCGIMMFYMTKSIIMKKSDLMCKVYYEFLNCVHNAGSVSSFCSDLEMLDPITRGGLKLIYRTDANLNTYFDLPDFSNCTELANATVGNICQDPQKLTAVSLANCSLMVQMYPYPYSTCMKYNYLVSCGRETASILGSGGCDLETVHKAFTNNSALVRQQFPNESFSHCVVDQCLSMENLPRISEAFESCGILQLWSKLTSQQSFLDFLLYDQDIICRLFKMTTDCLVRRMSQLVGISCNNAAMRDLITNNIQNLNQNLTNALQVCPVTTTDVIPVCEDKPFISKMFLAVNEYILYKYIHYTMMEDLCMLNNVLINSTIQSLWSYSGVNCTSLQIREALVNQTHFLSNATNITDISRCMGTDACSDPLLDVCEGMNKCASLTYDRMPDCTTWLGTLKYIQLQTQKVYGLKCPLESLSKAYYRLTRTDAQKCLVTIYHEVTYALNRTWDPIYKEVDSYFINMFMYEILNEVKMALAIKTSYLSALTITDFSEFEVIGNGTMMVKVHMIAGFAIAFSDVQIQQIFIGGILARQTNTSADPVIRDILTMTITVSNQTFTPDQTTAFCRDPSVLERVGNMYCYANWTGFCSDSTVQYQIVSCVYNTLRSVQANCSFRDVRQTLVSITRISKSCHMLVREGPRCSAIPDPDNCTAICTADEYCNDGKLCCASSSCASTVCMKPDVEGFCNTSDNIAAILMLEECGIRKYIPDGLSPFPDNQTKCTFLMNATQCLLRDPMFSEICNVTEVVSRIASVPTQLTSLLRGLNVSQNLFGTDFNHSVCASSRNMTGNITVYRYSGVLTLEREYQPELLNRSSLQFRYLDMEIISELNRTFHSGNLNRTYLNSSVRGFRNGSVIVYFESAFSANISRNDVLNTLIVGLVSSNSSIAGEIRPNSASILNQTEEGMTACRNKSLITSYIHKCANESAFGNTADEKNCTLFFRGLTCVMRPIEQTYFTYCSPVDVIRAVNVARSIDLIAVAMGNFTNAILECPEYLYLQKLAEQETILPSTWK